MILFIVGGALLVGGMVFVTIRDKRRREKREAADHELQREAFLRREQAQHKDLEQNLALGAESLRKLRLEVELMELQKRRMIGGPAIVGAGLDDEIESPAPLSNDDLNRLMAQKMERELKLLDVQIELARRDQAMRSDQLDYHDTMMEKAKLEIESLRLHIKEQQKRLDEGFGG
jgi:hypothetical protein